LWKLIRKVTKAGKVNTAFDDKPMKNELSNTTEILVRFNEADPLGIVWHGHYIRYFEDGREAFGAMYNLKYLDVYKKGFVTPVVSVQCDFKKSLRYGDTVRVETNYMPTDAAKLKFTYRLFNAATGDLVASGSSVQVFLSKEESLLQLSNPPFFEAWKKEHDQF
jgi:acyl-CoA thioester hydrolase